MSKRFAATVAAIFIAASSALAGEVSEETLAGNPTVNDLIAYAYSKSPEVAGARENWRAKIENIRVMGGYPDPELMVEQMGVDAVSRSIKLTAMVPFPGKLGAAEDSAAGEASVAKLGLDLTVRDLAVSVRQSAAEIAYLQGAVLIARKNGELLTKLSALSENAYTADQADMVDLVKARSEVAKVGFDKEVLEELLSLEKAKLNSKLARDADAPVGVISLSIPQKLAYSPTEIDGLVTKNPEEVRITRAEGRKAEADLFGAKLDRLPDFTLGAFKNPIDKGGNETYGFSVGITLPIWWGKNAGRVAKAEAELKRTELMSRAKELEVRGEARELRFRVINAERLYHLYRDTLIPQAARSLELSETWMKDGESSFADYAEVASTLYGFELAELRARSDHEKYLASLEKYAGRPLTLRGEENKEVSK